MGERARADSARRTHAHGRRARELVGRAANSAQLEPVRLRVTAARRAARFVAPAEQRQHADLDGAHHPLERERASLGARQRRTQTARALREQPDLGRARRADRGLRRSPLVLAATRERARAAASLGERYRAPSRPAPRPRLPSLKSGAFLPAALVVVGLLFGGSRCSRGIRARLVVDGCLCSRGGRRSWLWGSL